MQHTFLYISLPLFCTTTTLCLSLALYSKFVDMTINLSLKKQFPLSGFVFIDSLAASALQEAGGYAVPCQNNLGLHLGCHTFWLSYFTLVRLRCGRKVGRTVTWLPYFLGWVEYHIFLPMVLRFARESSAMKWPLVKSNVPCQLPIVKFHYTYILSM